MLELTVTNGLPGPVLLNGARALDSIRFIVRDPYWRSVPVSLQRVTHRNGGLTSSFVSAAAGYAFAVSLEIKAAEPDAIAIQGTLTAQAPMLVNRAGLVLLHPLSLAGSPIQIRRGDGRREQVSFPEMPLQSRLFTDVVGLFYFTSDHFGLDVVLKGEVFEIEDQRFWSDPSFKTYSGPQDRLTPYMIPAGAQITQTAVVRAERVVGSAARRPAQRAQHVGKRMPRIGITVQPDRLGASPEACRQIAALPLDHLLVEFGGVAWPQEAALRCLGAHRIACLLAPSEVDPVELAPLLQAWQPFALLLENASSSDLAHLSHLCPDAAIGWSTRAFLPSLLGTPERASDIISWSVTPCVHDIDDEVVMRSPLALAAMVEAARHVSGKRAIWLGPITLRPRFRPAARNLVLPPISADGAADDVDSRQGELFCAAWLVGYASAAALAGVELLSFFEPFGPRGLVEAATADPIPAYHALKRLAAAADAFLLPSLSELTDLCAILAYRQGDRAFAWIANLTPLALQIRLGTAGLSLEILSHSGWSACAPHATFIMCGYETALLELASVERTDRISAEAVDG